MGRALTLELLADVTSVASIVRRFEVAAAELDADDALDALDAFNALLVPFTATTRLTDSGAVEVVIAPSGALLDLVEKVEARNV